MTTNTPASLTCRRAARDPSTPPEALALLAGDEDARTRMTVAENPSTAPEVLAKLADDKLQRVRDNAIKNPNAPSYVRARAS